MYIICIDAYIYKMCYSDNIRKTLTLMNKFDDFFL